MSDPQPIEKAFTPKKATEWHFKIHPYFTKQASNVVAEYVKHYSKKGEIILDPFSGTGVTAIESLQNRRRTIAIDLSPLACFMTRQTCYSPLNIDQMSQEFIKLKNKCKDIVEFARNANNIKIESYQIKEWYPHNVRLPKNSDFENVENLFHKRQLIVLAKLLHEITNIRLKDIRDMFKLVFSNTIGKTNLTYMDNQARGSEGGGSSVFGKYRYWKPKESVIIDVWKNFENRFKYLISGKKKSNSTIGNYFKEPSKKTFNSFLNDKATFWCIQTTATNLDHIPDESIDYIYTDPPYGAHIAYLDLSTMWLAWLDMLVDVEQKKLEVIEGGDLDKSRKEYNELLFESIAEMGRVIKHDKWLSIVFQHKDVELWHAIHDAATHSGFKYINTVFQPTNTSSIHKKTNPLVVMGSQLIINFLKTRKTVISKIELKDESDAEKIILDIAERVIVEKNGLATTEDIYAKIVPHLMEVGLLHVANKRYKNLMPLLETNFHLDANNFWQIKIGSKLGMHIPKDKKIEYFLKSILMRKESVPFDEIIAEMMVNLINGSNASDGEILDVLQRIGISHDNINWSLKSETMSEQLILFDVKSTTSNSIPYLSKHNEIIYHLAVIGSADKFGVYIGKREQSDTNLMSAIKKNVPNFICKLPFSKMTSSQKKRIEQIDCIFCYKDGTPAWAFEVEYSTSILSALQRFKDLLEVSAEIGIERRLILLAPKSRITKLNQELSTSAYIGHPLYFEGKIRWAFFEDLLSSFKCDCDWKDIFKLPKF